MNNFDPEHIFNFNREYKLAKYPPKEDGYYMTIRCGLNGIYTHFDEWKNNMWQLGVLDNSSVIAYSNKQIPEEDIMAWCKESLKKYKSNNA